MLRKLRSQKRTVRVILALVVCGLAVSLVGTFAFTSLPSLSGQVGGAGTAAAGGREDEVQTLLTSIRQHEVALKSQPQNASLWLELANAQYDLGAKYFERQDWQAGQKSFAQAVASYERYLALVPDNVDARVDMATAAFYSNQPEVARQNFTKALEQAPQHQIAHLNYGIFLMEVDKNFEAATKHWQEVLKLNPQGPYAQRAKELLASVQQKR